MFSNTLNIEIFKLFIFATFKSTRFFLLQSDWIAQKTFLTFFISSNLINIYYLVHNITHVSGLGRKNIIFLVRIF